MERSRGCARTRQQQSATRRRGPGQLWSDGGVRPGTDRIDDDEHGHAVALWDNDGAIPVVGDEPNDHRDRRPGASGGKGFEGERSIPSPEPNVQHWVCWLLMRNSSGASSVGSDFWPFVSFGSGSS